MEQWRAVVGHEGYYEVSDQGRVRSIDRIVPHKRFGTWKLKGRILQPAPRNRCGHLVVDLCEKGIRQTIYVHRLVALAWLGPCPTGQEVRHGPKGIKDNSVSNLSYGTHQENGFDMRRDGTHTGRPVRRSDGKEYINMRIAAEETGYGCSYQNIWACCNGRLRTTGGYDWEYI